MKFLIDVDGVVADIVNPLLQEVNRQTGSNLTKEHITRFYFMNLENKILTKEQADVVFKLFEQEGYSRQLPIEKGAQKGIQTLREAGHEITWVTIPWESSKTWVYDRNSWLKENFNASHLDVIYASRKEKIHGDIIIDDHDVNVTRWLNYQRSVEPNSRKMGLVYKQPWNNESKIRKFSWAEAENLCNELYNIERK